MTDFLSEAVKRLAACVAESSGSTVTITKADACAIGAAISQAPEPVDEQRDMAVLDKYAELARIIGFEGDAWFNDPLASHEDIIDRAQELVDAEWTAKLRSDMDDYAQALAEERDAAPVAAKPVGVEEVLKMCDLADKQGIGNLTTTYLREALASAPEPVGVEDRALADLVRSAERVKMMVQTRYPSHDEVLNGADPWPGFDVEECIIIRQSAIDLASSERKVD